jgi:acyl carrier protein
VHSKELNTFLDLIRSLFPEDENGLITEKTNIKNLKEWSSLQNMIVVSEIDRVYEVIVSVEDFNSSSTLEELFGKIQSKKN